LIFPLKKTSEGVRSGHLVGQRVGVMFCSVERIVWKELDYHIDICRVTKGSHTERL
jgi:hypothetical protein